MRNRPGRKPKGMLRKKNTQRFIVPELDSLLLMWEEWWSWQWWYQRVVLDLQETGRRPKEGDSGFWKEEGAFLNFEAFRDYLLRVHQDNAVTRSALSDFKWPKAEDAEAEFKTQHTGLLHTVPNALESWTRCSRRVYEVDRTLQAFLAVTSLGRLKLRDIQLPHESYLLRLAYPVRLTTGINATSVLVTSVEGGISIMLISEEAKNYAYAVRPRLMARGRGVVRVDIAAFTRQCSVALETIVNSGRGQVQLLPDDDRTIEDGLRAMPEIDIDAPGGDELSEEDWELAIASAIAAVRVALGFAVYLQSIPLGVARMSQPRPLIQPGAVDPNCITEKAEICRISCVYELSVQERAVLEKGPRAIPAEEGGPRSWGFVRGYWRRLPGLGNVPGAPRTERVRSYVRRSDRAPDGPGVPQG